MNAIFTTSFDGDTFLIFSVVWSAPTSTHHSSNIFSASIITVSSAVEVGSLL
jgi:hypothetical protein